MMKKIFLAFICSIVLLQADTMVDANKTKVFYFETVKGMKEKTNKNMKCGSGKCGGQSSKKCGAVKTPTH